ncbi:hypothetical protein AXZ77_0510 [Thioclava sp. ES.031]|uniref:hypothetical protein n=1 Tax=Thioclava sp. ES.031 TaxID=1798203 RepID=UPI000BF4C80B|nr:hypothetical protein [Thioclava sp. ES.031]PFG61946.1 hypothetical protein AXZ77_0510 [Thioclava sp. ES.031]
MLPTNPNRARLLKDEEGAVTVDWVVLTASLVALGSMATVLIWQETASVSGKTAEFLDGQKLVSTFAENEINSEGTTGID